MPLRISSRTVNSQEIFARSMSDSVIDSHGDQVPGVDDFFSFVSRLNSSNY